MQPMSYNAWLYTYASPVNLTDPSGLCVFCNVGDRVRADTRGFSDGVSDGGGGKTDFDVFYDTASAIYEEPSSTSNIVGRLSDNQMVTVLSEPNNRNPVWSWRQIVAVNDGHLYYGWVYNRVLLDNCDGPSGWFGCMPLDFSKVTGTAGFGPNLWAESWCKDGPPCTYNYTKLRGLHNGIDFGAPAGTPLIWAGTSNGKVIPYAGDADPAIGVLYAGKTVVYGHVSDVRYVGIDDDVRPGQMIGLVGSDNPHLHFGLRRFATRFNINPLPYFAGTNLQSDIVAAMTGNGNYGRGYDPYYMVSFDSDYSDARYWFWGNSCDRLTGIVLNKLPQSVR